MVGVTSAPVSPNEHRLPTNVRPTHYDVTIKTDLEDLKFSGTVDVNLNILEDTETIVLHSSSLDLKDISIKLEDTQKDYPVAKQEYDLASERLSLSFEENLPAGTKAKLRIGFDGSVTANMMGYYYSTWNNDGKKSYYTLTQFEATAARRGFPCWDEPLLKATYTINLISRADLVNLSNMPAISEEVYPTNDSKEWKITKFEKTPPVSSYLVAYAVGPFKYIEDSFKSPLTSREIPLRIYATADNIDQAKFALEVKKKVLPLYETLFDVEYPLPKLDTLVVSDFDAGAMENWGLITGRTAVFLLDPAKKGVNAQKLIAATQSHEVAHMWFGNITTMAWWDNLYLNEGFATLMGEVIVIDKLFPEWKLYSEFINIHLNDALHLDARLSSHPIEVECPDANQINQIFDSLSYAKAASVLRMLSAYVGEEKFLKGVSLYLKKHLYANSVTKDLWKGIGEATGLDVSSMMENWVSKMGFPYLTVTETPDGIHVRQDRFLETGPAQEEDNKTLWHIPLNLVHLDSEGALKVDQTLLLTEKEMTIKLDTSKPYKLNANTTGVYRVLYSPERLTKIAQEAAKGDKVFSLDDRIGLVHDTFNLAEAGLAKVSSALDLVSIFRHEKEFLLWQGIRDKITRLVRLFWEDKAVSASFSDFRRQVFGPMVQRLGYDSAPEDSADTLQLRTLAITQAAAADDPAVIRELKRRFDEFVKTGDDSGIPTDIEGITYGIVVKHFGREPYELMKKIYAKPRTPTAQNASVLGLCSSEDPVLIEETMKYILTDARDQDVTRFIAYLSRTSASRRRVVQFIKDNYEQFYERFSANTSLSRVIQYGFEELTTEKDAAGIEEFFKDKDVSKFNLSLRQAIDSVRANAALLERSSADVAQWLQTWQKESKL